MLQLPAFINHRYGDNFAHILAFTLDREKELTLEHGTIQAIWGIDKRWHQQTFDMLRTQQGDTRLRIAAELYYHTFWLPMTRLSAVTTTAQFLFDTAVNMGVSTATQISQPETLLPILALRRIKEYTRIAGKPDKAQFLRGWITRTLDLLDYLAPRE